MSKEPEMREKWQHRPGDAYVPVFGDWVGGLAAGPIHRKWQQIGEPLASIEGAVLEGLRGGYSDDFNLAVIRAGEVVALLWMTEDMPEEPAVLAAVAKVALPALARALADG